MMVIFEKVSGQVKVLILILKKERRKQKILISVIGLKTKNMELEYKTILESDGIKAIGKMDKDMGRVS